MSQASSVLHARVARKVEYPFCDASRLLEWASEHFGEQISRISFAGDVTYDDAARTSQLAHLEEDLPVDMPGVLGGRWHRS